MDNKFVLPKDSNINLGSITQVCIPLCFEDPTDPRAGAHDRFKAAVQARNLSTTLVIQTGGPKPLDLCKLMKQHLENGQQVWASRYVGIPRGWGTRSEIKNAFMLIRELRDAAGNRIKTSAYEFKVYIASNRSHLRRVKYYVWLYNTEKWRIVFKEANHPFSVMARLREIVALPIEMLKDLHQWWKKAPIRREQKAKLRKATGWVEEEDPAFGGSCLVPPKEELEKDEVHVF